MATSSRPAVAPDAAAFSVEPSRRLEAEVRTPAVDGTPAAPVLGAALGLVAGLGTGLGVWASYPPAKHMGWVPGTIFGGSTAVVAGVFLLLVYHGRRRAADWFVAAYLVPVVLFAMLQVGREMLEFLIVKAPGLLGVAMIPLSPPLLPVQAVAVLGVACALLVGASYGLWCLDALPRLRVVLALVGLLCLAVAAGQHGYWLSGGPPAPVTPQVPGQ